MLKNQSIMPRNYTICRGKPFFIYSKATRLEKMVQDTPDKLKNLSCFGRLFTTKTIALKRFSTVYGLAAVALIMDTWSRNQQPLNATCHTIHPLLLHSHKFTLCRTSTLVPWYQLLKSVLQRQIHQRFSFCGPFKCLQPLKPNLNTVSSPIYLPSHS